MGGRARIRLVGVLAISLCATIAFGAGLAEAKKKKVDETLVVNAAIPAPTATAWGELSSTINVGNKFKGLKIRDVNVTVQTTGLAADSASDLVAQLSAPNGASSNIFYSLDGQSVGPLTLDDEARMVLGGTSPPTSGYFLPPPYQGTAQPGVSVLSNFLSVLDNGRVRGDWILRIFDNTAADTSVLNTWRLEVKAGEPYETKD